MPFEEKPLDFPAAPKNTDGTVTTKQRILMEEAAQVKLTSDELGRLDGDAKIQRKLESERLKYTLRVILEADNSLDALDMAMEDGDFIEFCDEVLTCIGFQETGDGDGEHAEKCVGKTD